MTEFNSLKLPSFNDAYVVLGVLRHAYSADGSCYVLALQFLDRAPGIANCATIWFDPVSGNAWHGHYDLTKDEARSDMLSRAKWS